MVTLVVCACLGIKGDKKFKKYFFIFFVTFLDYLLLRQYCFRFAPLQTNYQNWWITLAIRPKTAWECSASL
ncbi:MAG: hypothetical protein CMK08_00030 [Ponticaulis sp.]|nr:hypothetical protein [Ponticaulis sp.]